MKKLNNKGFMLAEVIIVTTVMITSLVGLYKGFSNTYKAYEIKSRYYDTKTIYALKNMENFLIDEMILNKYAPSNNNFYIEITKDLDSDEYHEAYIDKFITENDIDQLYLTKFTKTNLDSLKSNTNDDELIKYIDYIIDQYISNSNSDEYTFILIAKTNTEKYSNLKIV